MAQDSGLWKRGLLLFGVLALIALAVLIVVLWRPDRPTTDGPLKAEHVVAALPAPTAPVPGALPWAGYFYLASHLPSPEGWKIRYSAAIAMARGGSLKLPLPIMREMLNEDQQKRNYTILGKDGKYTINNGAAQELNINALKAFGEWHKKNKADKKFDPENADLEKVYHAIDQLTQSSNDLIRLEATKTLQELGRSG
jgi:hypothetical protein